MITRYHGESNRDAFRVIELSRNDGRIILSLLAKDENGDVSRLPITIDIQEASRLCSDLKQLIDETNEN
jgi:hypothetical protein